MNATDQFFGFPTGKFGAILCDPPWDFSSFSGGGNRHPKRHYECLSDEDIMSLPVSTISADDSSLFLWTTCPHLPFAIRLGEHWGFTYKTVAFSWMKINKDGTPFMGLGSWTRSNVELCLLFTRGKPKRQSAAVRQAILEPKREHSRKPDCVRERIEQLVLGPYIELFARDVVSNWSCWGNQVGLFSEDKIV